MLRSFKNYGILLVFFITLSYQNCSQTGNLPKTAERLTPETTDNGSQEGEGVNITGNIEGEEPEPGSSNHFSFPFFLAAMAIDNVDHKGNAFGWVVAAEGDELAVGAPNLGQGSATDKGYVQIYSKATGTWAPTQKIEAPDAHNENFGTHVILKDGFLIIGDPYSDSQGVNSGIVYIYTKVSGQWQLSQRIEPVNAQANLYFGRSFSFDGDRLIVTAQGIDWLTANPLAYQLGQAMIFDKNNSWAQESVLTATGPLGDFQFAENVHIEGDEAFVTNNFVKKDQPVIATYYKKVGSAWTKMQEIVEAKDLDHIQAVNVQKHDGKLYIAITFKNKAENGGKLVSKVEVFSLNQGQWESEQEILLQETYFFGQYIAWCKGKMYVGSPYTFLGNPNNENTYRDAVGNVTYFRQDTKWEQMGGIFAKSPKERSRFGHGLTCLGNELLIGAPGVDENKVYRYEVEKL